MQTQRFCESRTKISVVFLQHYQQNGCQMLWNLYNGRFNSKENTMNELKKYVENKNRWNLIFNKRSYDLAIAADRQSIANSLDSDLSPENLTCDGELSRSQVIQRKRFYDKAAEQLLALDPSVKMYEYC
jgi:hypothetical protein